MQYTYNTSQLTAYNIQHHSYLFLVSLHDVLVQYVLIGTRYRDEEDIEYKVN